jgi:hypothetical protein
MRLGSWDRELRCAAAVLGIACAAIVVTATANASAGTSPKKATLKVAIAGQGRVSSRPARISCPGRCAGVFARGTRVRLIASPTAGWKFARWSTACGSAPSCTVAATASKTVKATFSKIPPPPPGTTRDNPIPLGSWAPIPGGFITPAGWQMRVNSVTPDATAQVLAANMFNDPPQAGHQFFMFSVSYEWTGQGAADAMDADYGLDAVGAANVSYTAGLHDSCGVLPDPDFGLETIGVSVFTGGTITGNECFSVLDSDASSLVLFQGDPAKSATWFALR